MTIFFDECKQKIAQTGRQRFSATLRFEYLKKYPITVVRSAAGDLMLSTPIARAAIESLVKLEIITVAKVDCKQKIYKCKSTLTYLVSYKNLLYESPPYAVEHAILSLANNLKTARLRRNLTMKEMAEKLGTVVKVIRAAENGIMTTSIVFYFSLIMGVWLIAGHREFSQPIR